MSLNPLLTEGSSPILFISVIYSSKVILIESQKSLCLLCYLEPASSISIHVEDLAFWR